MVQDRAVVRDQLKPRGALQNHHGAAEELDLRQAGLQFQRPFVQRRPGGEGLVARPARIGRMVKDVVEATFGGNLSEIRMSSEVLEATLELRTFLFDNVYENEAATAEFKKATGILGGLWEKIRERPRDFLDERTIADQAYELAGAEPDFVAFVEGEAGLTRAQLLAQAEALSAALYARGLRPGDVVAFQVPNWREAAVINLDDGHKA